MCLVVFSILSCSIFSSLPLSPFCAGLSDREKTTLSTNITVFVGVDVRNTLHFRCFSGNNPQSPLHPKENGVEKTELEQCKDKDGWIVPSDTTVSVVCAHVDGLAFQRWMTAHTITADSEIVSLHACGVGAIAVCLRRECLFLRFDSASSALRYNGHFMFGSTDAEEEGMPKYCFQGQWGFRLCLLRPVEDEDKSYSLLVFSGKGVCWASDIPLSKGNELERQKHRPTDCGGGTGVEECASRQPSGLVRLTVSPRLQVLSVMESGGDLFVVDLNEQFHNRRDCAREVRISFICSSGKDEENDEHTTLSQENSHSPFDALRLLHEENNIILTAKRCIPMEIRCSNTRRGHHGQFSASWWDELSAPPVHLRAHRDTAEIDSRLNGFEIESVSASASSDVKVGIRASTEGSISNRTHIQQHCVRTEELRCALLGQELKSDADMIVHSLDVTSSEVVLFVTIETKNSPIRGIVRFRLSKQTNTCVTRIDGPLPRTLVVTQVLDHSIVFLSDDGVYCLLPDIPKTAILHNLIMYENAHLADRLCSLNGWNKRGLRLHALKLGLKHRQESVVRQALSALGDENHVGQLILVK